MLSAGLVIAGDDNTLVQKMFGADAIIRVRLQFDRPIPRRWPNRECKRLGWAFPLALAERACRTATIEAVLLGPHDGKLPAYFGPTIDDCWWWSAHQQGSAEILLFLIKTPHGWQLIQGVEGVVEASGDNSLVKRVIQWRMLGRERRLQAARAALYDKNPDVVDTAISALCLDDRSSVKRWVEAARIARWHGHSQELDGLCDRVIQIRDQAAALHGRPSSLDAPERSNVSK